MLDPFANVRGKVCNDLALRVRMKASNAMDPYHGRTTIVVEVQASPKLNTIVGFAVHELRPASIYVIT